jgi:lipid A 3-O-deacylase
VAAFSVKISAISIGERDRILIQRMRLILLVAMVGALAANAETPNTSSPTDADSPVAQVRSNKSWEYGPFVNGGMGTGNRDNFFFFRAGFQLSKIISRPLHTWPFPGQFEFGGNVMPLWQAYTPAPHEASTICTGTDGTVQPCEVPFGGGTYHGVSITPVIFRWNFLTGSRRIQPWFQAAGGLIYTTHKFPPDVLVPHGTPGGTSVWNFSPQGGFGIHYFTRAGRSWDLGVNGVHISSASLGDRNPGVNASVEAQLGYTFWK